VALCIFYPIFNYLSYFSGNSSLVDLHLRSSTDSVLVLHLSNRVSDSFWLLIGILVKLGSPKW
jgi:hypothetical protein